MTARRRQVILIGTAIVLVGLQLVVRAVVGVSGTKARVIIELIVFAMGTGLTVVALATLFDTLGTRIDGMLPPVVGFIAFALAVYLAGLISPVLAKQDADEQEARWRRQHAPAEAWDP